MGDVTVLWYSGNTLFERLIRWRTHSRFSHVGVLINGTVFEEQAPGVVIHGGVEATSIATQAAAYRLLPLPDRDTARVLAYLTAQIGHHYNVAGIFTDALASFSGYRLTVAADGDFTCSGLVAAALQEAGYVWPHDPHSVSPGDLATWLAPLTQGAPPLSVLARAVGP